MRPLKELVSSENLSKFIEVFSEYHPAFNTERFIESLNSDEFTNLELKNRWQYIADWLYENVELLDLEILDIFSKIAERLVLDKVKNDDLIYMFIPEFVSRHCTQHPKQSFTAFKKITPLATCEFAIRPFIEKYPKQARLELLALTKSNNEHHRRLASEGSRPLLPWGNVLSAVKENPLIMQEVLNNLKDDSSAYVRKSVANHLNDVSKNHPEYFLSILKEWISHSTERNKLLKHASRTLLKAGDLEVMKIFGYASPEVIRLLNFKAEATRVEVEERLNFTFDVENIDKSAVVIRLEYAIYFLLKNGKYSKKVFKISDRKLKSEERISMRANHHFKKISTRKYYEGEHKLALIINGEEKISKSFRLILLV